MFVRIIRRGVSRGSIEITEQVVTVTGMGAYFRKFAYEYDGGTDHGAIIDAAIPSETAWKENAYSVNELAKQLGVELEESP